MHKNDFEFIIASPFDREKLVCEICYKGKAIAEISQETEEFMLEIYPPGEKKWWNVPLVQFQEALEYAKKHLVGK